MTPMLRLRMVAQSDASLGVVIVSSFPAQLIRPAEMVDEGERRANRVWKDKKREERRGKRKEKRQARGEEREEKRG